ncbi:HlyD family secretion protein [Agarivorans gilvus]|uniref:Hemolysin D n=1 Tax=Agarivorans gilvus TaxID=680279 RepID=A0ABQ1I828_9ALTE|nr:HlyD family secretion protein [Agarivorans gilvus]GGB20528.1 hemolysin D [Agarivorans gilvus]
MKAKLVTLLIVAATLVLVAVKFQHYIENPWTRDGYVRAHIVEVTSRVTGPLVALHVTDNTRVKQGDLLFEIDPRVYQVALDKAKANFAQAQAALERSQNEQHRGRALEQRTPGSLSTLSLNNLDNAVESATANVKAAQAAVNDAELNLGFTKVYASTDGYITNLHLALGAQVVANQPIVALIDENSFWIEGFFKETDIEQIAMGDDAQITLMSYTHSPFSGVVESIGYGIAQQDGSTGSYMLPNVNPTFQWVRLAQRLPVKIKVSQLPDDVQLRVGTSASIIIKGV